VYYILKYLSIFFFRKRKLSNELQRFSNSKKTCYSDCDQNDKVVESLNCIEINDDSSDEFFTAPNTQTAFKNLCEKSCLNASVMEDTGKQRKLSIIPGSPQAKKRTKVTLIVTKQETNSKKKIPTIKTSLLENEENCGINASIKFLQDLNTDSSKPSVDQVHHTEICIDNSSAATLVVKEHVCKKAQKLPLNMENNVTKTQSIESKSPNTRYCFLKVWALV